MEKPTLSRRLTLLRVLFKTIAGTIQCHRGSVALLVELYSVPYVPAARYSRSCRLTETNTLRYIEILKQSFVSLRLAKNIIQQLQSD